MLLPRVNAVSEIFPDKVNKLLEGDEPVMVGIKFLEDEDQVVSAGDILDEVAPLGDEEDELFKGDLLAEPDFTVGRLVSSVEQDLDEVNRKNDGNELIEFDVIVLFLQE